MSNVNVRQIRLALNDITSLPSIVIRELAKDSDTQIFISKNLYDELEKQSKRFCIWIENVFGGSQYFDGVEKAFLFKRDLDNYDFVMQMNFVSHSNNFKQLTYFGTKGIHYTHFKKDMKNILIIDSN